MQPWTIDSPSDSDYDNDGDLEQLREQVEDMADECWQDLEGERDGEPLPNGSWQTLMQLW